MQSRKYILSIFALTVVLLWVVVFQLPDDKLHLIACNVGQGDAILAVYKNYQILTDGGTPDKKVIECIGRHIPFWDRHIEVVVNTHPQVDHFGGLTEVFKRYKVDYFLANALSSSSQDYEVLRKWVGSKGVRVVNPVAGTSIRLGLIHYDVFWPNLDFLSSEGMSSLENKLSTFTSNRDPNDFSIQAILSLGEFRALLTGDIGLNMNEMLQGSYPTGSVDYIKIPHHGSKYGLTQILLEKFVPKVGVISVGKNNTYGHPTREILDMLSKNNIKTYRTDLDGEIEFVSDGKNFWRKNTGSLFSF